MILSLIAETPFFAISYDTKCSFIYEELLKYNKGNIALEKISDYDFDSAFIKKIIKKKKESSNTQNICKHMQKKRGKFLFSLEKN